jgi:hypothetical protein
MVAARIRSCEGRMKNAERIVRELDSHLDHELRLVLYGRAAIALGFANPPPETLLSLDVDVIIPVEELEQLRADTGFWAAQEATNHRLHGAGLYITHLFTAADVFLRSDWLRHIVPIQLDGLRWLRLFRPATIDLMLTKMMRGADPIDRSDLEFLIRSHNLSRREVQQALNEAVLPEVPELKELFEQARPFVLELAAANEPKH